MSQFFFLILFLCGGAVSKGMPVTCEDKCKEAGHCCTGTVSSFNKPSCAMGCILGNLTESEVQCNTTCAKFKNCTENFLNITFSTCETCPERWLPPGHAPGWWPPGYQLPSCNSADDNECQLGCHIMFNPGFTPPPPPTPQPPPPVPPPAPTNKQLNFSSALSNYMVLQQAPASAAVFGFVGFVSKGKTAAITVLVKPNNSDSYAVAAKLDGEGGWVSLLRPTAASPATYSITAHCTAGCTGSVTLAEVVFGDVWLPQYLSLLT